MKNYAVILAAGIGSRLYPLTENYPKSLVKVNGREILDYQIQGYLKAGIEENNIYIVTGYKHEMIAKYLQNNYPKVNEIYSPDYLTTNNMYSLYLGLNEIFKSSNDFRHLFINNADCLYDEVLMKDFVNCSFENAIATEMGVYIDESMKVVQRKDTSLVNIAKTITETDSSGVSVDLYKYSLKTARRLYEIVKDYIEVKKDLKQWTEVAFPILFETEKVFPYDIKHKKWVEVDNNDDLALADKLFSNFDIKTKKLLICDMDGTLYVGKNPVQGSIDFIKNITGVKTYFLTNNTSKIPNDYVERLRSFGIETSEKDILTPLSVLETYLKEKNYTSVYMVANKKVLDYMTSRMSDVTFEFDKEKNQAVILTYDTEIEYTKLKNMCDLLNNTDVEYITTHTDVFCPSELGPIPDIGSFIKLIEVTNQRVPDIILGKPSLNLVKSVLYKYLPNEIAIIGDRLYTDKKLADNMTSDFVCVLSGETTRLDVQNFEGKYPAIVVKTLKELNV